LDLTKLEQSLAELYYIQLDNGNIYRFTSSDSTHVVGGQVYSPIGIKRGNISVHADLKIDACDVTIALNAFLVNGYTIAQAVDFGWFDNAYLMINLIDIDDSLITTINIFEGHAKGGIKYDESEMILTFTSILDLLNQSFPKIIYQEQCNLKLYSTYCGLNKITFKRIGTVLATASPSKDTIYSSIFSFSNNPSGFFKYGELKMTAGDNDTISRTIRGHYDGYVKLYQPFNFDCLAGETLEAYAGCDKSGTTCDSTSFDNYDNFLGFEYIPPPETMMQ